MSPAVVLRAALAVIMIAVAAYHCGRLVTGQRQRREQRWAGHQLDVDLTHAAMGVAMATMLAGSLNDDGARLLAFAFIGPALWFSWRAMRSYVIEGPRAVGTCVGQALACIAMVYMLALAASSVHPGAVPGTQMAGMAGMPGMVAAGGPLALGRPVGALLLLAMAVATVAATASIGRARRPRHDGPSGGPDGLAPVIAASCQLAMNVSAVYMLALAL
jgi:hypothetical protein